MNQNNNILNSLTVIVGNAELTKSECRGSAEIAENMDGIIKTVNSLGETPDDVMSILQALEQAGALNAELIVI